MDKLWYKSWTFWSALFVAIGSVWVILDPTSDIAKGLIAIAVPSTAYGIRRAIK